MFRTTAAVLVLASITFTPCYAEWIFPGAVRIGETPGLGDYGVPLYPDGTYREGIQSPDQFLGHRLGARATAPSDIIRYFEYLAAKIDNVSLHTYAHTYEGRALVYLVVTSEENAARIDDIRRDLARLSNPSTTSADDARRIIDGTPAVAWMAYGIHGDELSSCDAALALAFQLAAGTDERTRRITDELVVVIDPLQNPDGRARWVVQLEQWRGAQPNYDVRSLHHRGVWPYGRGNHYLFDLNRDWFSLVHPESRGRTSAVLDWMPHYMLDCHEMSPTDTYLFSPPREPFNPFMTDYIHKWWDRVAGDQARAFDAYGWSYYTRDWNEEFFPGYGSSWGIYLGAIGMLFEQAGVDGSAVRRPEGTIMTYRETVHHQFVGSFENLRTVAAGRRELLDDYYRVKLANVQSPASAFVFPPSANGTRLDHLAATLEHQRIEVERLESATRVATAVSRDGRTVRGHTFPEGSLVVRTNQPLKQLIETILTFDIRIPTAFLETERKELLKHNDSRLYDSTGWSLAHAYGLDAFFVASLPRVRTAPHTVRRPEGSLKNEDSPVGFVFDCTDDRSTLLLARLLSRGARVWASREPFANDGREFARGSYHVRLNANPGLDADDLRALAEDAGVDVYGVTSALGTPPYVDLGGNEFSLLVEPRIALVGGSPVSLTSFGAIWHLIDARLGLRATTLDVSTLAGTDLDTYNVLVLPDNWGGPTNYKNALGNDGVEKLRTWVRAGGTLVAEGGGAAFLADSSVALGSVRQRRQALSSLDVYNDALAAARDAEESAVDSVALWEGRTRGDDAGKASEEGEPGPDDRKKLERDDERLRRLFPRGAILQTDLDPEHWLAAGCGDHVPVMFNTDFAYLAASGVDVPARLAPPERLRLAGLVWDEARVRWGETAYATRERVGKGQVILFATLPNFRGYFYGSERMLANALLLGPGMGTATPLEW
jgi:hypothetical protein